MMRSAISANDPTAAVRLYNVKTPLPIKIHRSPIYRIENIPKLVLISTAIEQPMSA